MIRIEMYKIAGRSFLKNSYLSSVIQFESCCGVCWCCRRLKKNLDEFERKGFNTFNSHIQCWLTILKLCQYLRTNFLKKSFFLFLSKNAKYYFKRNPIEIYKK